jgi:hypothetical protein
MTKTDTLNALQAVATGDDLAPLPLLVGQHINTQHARRAHLEEAFAHHDAVVLLRHADVEMGIVTKAVLDVRNPFCWVITVARAQEKWMVGHALRLYGDEADLSTWRGDPLEAFAEALGIDFEAGAQPVRFLPFRRVNASPQNIGAIITALDMSMDKSFDFTQLIKVTNEGTELSWVYFIDKTAYEASLRVARH